MAGVKDKDVFIETITVCSLKEPVRKSPVKAIRAKCLDCSGNQWSEVEDCLVRDCPIFPFRFGKNPFSSRTGSNREYTEEERKAIGERLKAGRVAETTVDDEDEGDEE